MINAFIQIKSNRPEDIYLRATFVNAEIKSITFELDMKMLESRRYIRSTVWLSSEHPRAWVASWQGRPTKFVCNASIMDIKYKDQRKVFTTPIQLNKSIRHEFNLNVNVLENVELGVYKLFQFGINSNWDFGIQPCNKNGNAVLLLYLRKLPSAITAIVVRCKLKFEVNNKIKTIREVEHKFSHAKRRMYWDEEILVSSDLLFMKKFHCIINVNVIKVFGRDNEIVSPYRWGECGLVDTEETMDNDEDETQTLIQQFEELRAKLASLEEKLPTKKDCVAIDSK